VIHPRRAELARLLANGLTFGTTFHQTVLVRAQELAGFDDLPTVNPGVIDSSQRAQGNCGKGIFGGKQLDSVQTKGDKIRAIAGLQSSDIISSEELRSADGRRFQDCAGI
jgi:hypothetical protein